MKDWIAYDYIVPPPGNKGDWIASYGKLAGKARMGSIAAAPSPRWTSDFFRAARIGILVLASCTLIRSSEPQLPKQGLNMTAPVHKEFGEASWYGPGFQGQETASGAIFDTNEMTAAHPSLPLGTKVKVTNLEKNKTVEVKITDRGPYAKGRDIDLSHAAAKKLGMVKKGTAKVKIVTKPSKKKISKKKSSPKNLRQEK